MNAPDLRRILKEAPLKGFALVERTARDILFNKRTLVIIILICIPGLIGGYWSSVLIDDIPQSSIDLKEAPSGSLIIEADVPQWLPKGEVVLEDAIVFHNRGNFPTTTAIVIELEDDSKVLGPLEIPITEDGEEFLQDLELDTTELDGKVDLRIRAAINKEDRDRYRAMVDLGDLAVDDPADVPVAFLNPLLVDFSYYEEEWRIDPWEKAEGYIDIFNGTVEVRADHQINNRGYTVDPVEVEFPTPVEFRVEYPKLVERMEEFNIIVGNTTPLPDGWTYEFSLGVTIDEDVWDYLAHSEDLDNPVVIEGLKLGPSNDELFMDITVTTPQGKYTLYEDFGIEVIGRDTLPEGTIIPMSNFTMDDSQGTVLAIYVPSVVVSGYPVNVYAAMSGSTYWYGPLNVTLGINGETFEYKGWPDGEENIFNISVPEDIIPDLEETANTRWDVEMEFLDHEYDNSFSLTVGPFPNPDEIYYETENILVPTGISGWIDYPIAFTTDDPEPIEVRVFNTGEMNRDVVAALYINDEVLVSDTINISGDDDTTFTFDIPEVLNDTDEQNFTVLVFIDTEDGYFLIGGGLVQSDVVSGTYKVEITKQIFLITFIQVYLLFIVLLVAFIYGKGLIGNELDNKTFTVTITAPITRLELCGYKYLGYLLTLTLICSIPVAITYFAFGAAMGVRETIAGAGLLGIALFMVFLAIAVYGAVFLFIGTFKRWSTVIGLIYLFLWEMFLGRVDFFVQKVAVGHYIRSAVLPTLEPYANNVEEILMLQNFMTSKSMATSQPMALLVLVIITVVFIGLSILRLRHMDFE